MFCSKFDQIISRFDSDCEFVLFFLVLFFLVLNSANIVALFIVIRYEHLAFLLFLLRLKSFFVYRVSLDEDFFHLKSQSVRFNETENSNFVVDLEHLTQRQEQENEKKTTITQVSSTSKFCSFIVKLALLLANF